ncbi:MAG: ATP-binding protein [Myxococcota bacterium]
MGLGEDETPLASVVEALPLAVAYYDVTGVCRFASSNYQALFTNSPVGEPLSTHFDGALEAIRRMLDAALAGRRGEDTMLASFPRGRRYLSVTATPDGDPVRGVTLALADVSSEQRALEARRFFNDAMLLLETDGDSPQIWSRMAELAVATCADWCSIHLRPSDAANGLAAIAYKEESARRLSRIGERAVLSGSAIDDALQGRPARVVADGVSPFGDAASPCRSAIVVPLIGRDGGIAAMTLAASDDVRDFDAETLAAAEDLSRRFGLAASNTRLYRAEQRARKAAERSAERTTRLQAITAQLVGALDAEAIGTILVGQAVAALRAYAGMIMMPTIDGTHLTLLQSNGYDSALLDHYRTIEIDGKSPAAVAFQTGRPVWVHSPQDYAREFPQLAVLAPGTAALCAVPLVTQDRSTAVLGLSFHEVQTFAPEDQSFLYALARQGAQAIERARLHRDARDADRRKDEFLAMLSHELRNPLAPMLIGIQLIRETKSPAQAEHLLHTIERQVHHLARLVDDLLDVSRVTRGKIELRRTRVEIGPIARAAADAASHIMTARRHELTCEISDGLWMEADPVRLDQVFTNLLNNAAKYTEPGGKVEFSLRRRGSDLIVRVRDTGIGISSDMLPHVFEPFMQASRALDRAQGGLGIGLTMVKRIAEMHGGHVAVSSEGMGRGSEFIVQLPLAEAPPEQVATIPIPQRKLHRACLKVLVVDDNVDAAESLAQLLTLWGHKVEVAGDGPSALRIADSLSPELVLLDIGLPGMDGYQVAAALRATDPRTAATHVVAVSGYGQARDRERSREAGFDAHLTKPVDIARLRQLVSDIASTP